jgi:adenosylcobinamide-GDP ribazoletransferase
MIGLRRALALFTVVPVGHLGNLDRAEAVAALRWLPLLGAGLGAVAGLPAVAVLHWAPHALLLGAALSVLVLALLTRGLHLDGLADTLDGLGSRAPSERALEIMRRSDVGPFGVIAIVIVLLIDVTALASYDGNCVWWPLAALAVAAATGRLAALLAAHQSVPPARSEAAALLVTLAFLRHVRGRLGGVTGDVFGALVEITTALTLAGLALS